jgi:predicted amidohydrolase YtcJ
MAATRVFHNGKVYTVNKEQPWAEAVALEGNKIVYVGSSEEALKLADDGTDVCDLDGKMMLPGFIDGHIHPLMTAAFASGALLSECKTKEEILDVVREYVEAHPDNEAYFGQGFADTIFAAEHPLGDDLDAICADKPILLVASSCHGAWCNHKALELGGVDKNTPDITPGSNYFVRDEEGNPTGRCIESCYIQVAKGANYFPVEAMRLNMAALGKEFAALGYTAFADCGVFGFVVDSLTQEFADFLNSDECTQRLFGGFYLATNVHDMHEALEGAGYLAENLEPTDRLALKYFKILGDGIIEARSAGMAIPYDNGVKALPNFNSEEAAEMGLAVAEAGYDLYMHAIGDATTTVALDMAQAVREAGYDDTRIAIAHSQCWQPGEIERAGKLNVFINSTGSWHTVSNEAYKKYLGANIQGYQYPIRSLIDAGCKYGQGSDFPVADGKPNPFVSIEVGMRRCEVGATDVVPADLCEAPTLEESIESFTINNAYEVRMEDKIGSIEVGKLADLVIVDKNLFDIPTEEIHTCKVLETIRDGITTYKA